jgi:hypothetical protein
LPCGIDLVFLRLVLTNIWKCDTSSDRYFASSHLRTAPDRLVSVCSRAGCCLFKRTKVCSARAQKSCEEARLDRKFRFLISAHKDADEPSIRATGGDRIERIYFGNRQA